MLVFYASFIRVTRLSSAVRQDSGKTPLIAWTHVSPRYTQFNSFGVKEADKQEEEGGVRESSHAENGRGFQPVLERESCYPNVFDCLPSCRQNHCQGMRSGAGQGEA